MLLQSLRNLQLDRKDFDECVALLSQAVALKATYKEVGFHAPEFVADAEAQLRREIENRRRDQVAARIKALRAQRETLKTVSERRKDVDAELAELESIVQA